MHEMSLALSIVDLVSERAKSEGGTRVNQVEVEVGILAGVLVDSLVFCFEAASKGTIVADAVLKISETNGEGRCHNCEKIFPLTSLMNHCPFCNDYMVSIIKGDGLRVLSFTMDE